MTQTLTTERLREIASSPSFSANPLSHEVKHMARELLANREAQPVAWVMIDDLTDKSIVSTPAYRSKEDAEERTMGQIAPLFIAPPAPAVSDVGAIFEAAIDECRKSDVIDEHAWNHGVLVVMAKFKECRAAILAQPVSQGCKLVPVEVLATASTLIDLCRMYTILHDTGSYKERTINDCKNTMEVIDGFLAAAPEVGN